MRTLLAAFLISTPAAALAQADATPQATTRAELVKNLSEGFTRADSNGDGFLSRAEIGATEQRAAKEASAKLSASLRKKFQELDKDKNGQLSQAEFSGLATVKRNPNAAASALQLHDANKDGKVSRNEFAANALRMFDRMDTNKDGRVSSQEMRQAQARK